MWYVCVGWGGGGGCCHVQADTVPRSLAKSTTLSVTFSVRNNGWNTIPTASTQPSPTGSVAVFAFAMLCAWLPLYLPFPSFPAIYSRMVAGILHVCP